MKDTSKNGSNDIIIDLRRIFKAVWHRVWIIALAAILCAALALVGTVYLIAPKYQSSSMFYVNNNALSIDGAPISIDSGDITAAKSLVDTYIVILNSRACLNDVIDYFDVDYTYDELKKMISASAVNSTEIFEVVVTSTDPEEAEKIANAIAYILPKRISSIVEGTSANVVDYGIVPVEPSSPNRIKNTFFGGLIGLVLALTVVVVREIFDVTIRTEEDVAETGSYPILAAVPDMLSNSKGGYYYDSKKNKNTPADAANKVRLVGDDISFAATEAYKLLRTKIQFSFADDKNCRVLGVSSALAGEGKSLSSINLAYSLAQLEKRVLLIDCDMRRPSLAAKLNIPKTPGLSNYLTDRVGMDMVLQTSDESFKNASFSIITAGRVPPNPIELLSSKKMFEMLEVFREHYDYIILDLPPVCEVSDAIVAAKLVDGILMVVCQNYCSRVDYAHAVEQFEFVDSRILGVIMNRVSESGRRYGYKYRKQYYKTYGYSSYTSSSDKE